MMFTKAKLFHPAGEGSGGGDSHDLGWYATESALTTAHPTATDGDWAIVGATDTVWVWDTDTSAWVDTDTKGQVTSVNNQTGAVTIGANDVLPTQTGYSGRVLGTDGFVAGWVEPEIVQRSALPVASQDEEGNIYQFVGTTDANYTNGYFYECVSDGATPPVYSWTRVDVQPAGSSLPTQTGNAGKFLTTDGTDASWGNAVQNTATQSSSLTVLGTATTGYYNVNIGTNSQCGTQSCVAVGYNAQTSTTVNYTTVVGYYASGWGDYSTAIGSNTSANKIGVIAIGYRVGAENININGTYTVGIGYNSQTQANYSIAIGAAAKVTAANAIQMGTIDGIYGYTNSDANTFKVGNANGNFEIMSANGTIPTARLTKVNTTITLTAADWSGGSQTVTVTGMTATGIALVSPDPTDQAAYTSAGIICTAQAADSLTFTATTTPSGDIDVNVVML